MLGEDPNHRQIGAIDSSIPTRCGPTEASSSVRAPCGAPVLAKNSSPQKSGRFANISVV